MEIHTNKLTKPIVTLNFKERSLLFAELAQIAYLEKKNATKIAKQLGFTTIEYYDLDGAQTYRFMNKHDIVIACRGTEPTEFNDLKADLQAYPVKSETISRVHRGFKAEVDELWPMVREDITRTQNKDKELWFCGHSLGAAMATIMASRCKHNLDNLDPKELYTFGSPRVGWPTYVDSLSVVHHRWKNNNDIVTSVPLWVMGYKHHGQQHYLNTWGNVRTPSGWQLFKDKLRGMWRGIKKGKIDNFSDHSMTEYVKHLAKHKDVSETIQI